ncbi:MAG TPA: Fe-S cluster assembly scaffold protein NifU [Clostridiales bacterium UBA8960]|jgi:nitrogen fixation NifU-like protein|nr:Fe-S cluster assembly scaffold protein NifU [Clostridiales bacterium UBA8960]
MYTEIVMDHFMNPRNVGEIENADGIGEVGNVKCGDIMRIYIKVVDETISEIKFKTFGCGSAIAASSVATEIIKGLTIEEALKVTNKQVVEALGGLPAVKVHCSVLAEQALKAAIYDYASKNDKTYAGLEGFDPADDHDHHDVVEIEF